MKIICLAIFFAFFCRKDKDEEAKEFLDENNADLDQNEEYLHQNKSIFNYRPRVHAERLNEAEVEFARQERLKEVQMWNILRQFFVYFCSLILLSMIIYSNAQTNSFLQVKHLKKYFFNTRQSDQNYLKVCFVFLLIIQWRIFSFKRSSPLMIIGNG